MSVQMEAAYYYVGDHPRGRGVVDRTVRLGIEGSAEYIVDLNPDGQIMGIEVLGNHDPRTVHAVVLGMVRIQN